MRIATAVDNYAPAPDHQDRPTSRATGAAANNVELAYVPFYASGLTSLEAQSLALRSVALDGTDQGPTANRRA